MKTLLYVFLLLLMASNMFSQAPGKISTPDSSQVLAPKPKQLSEVVVRGKRSLFQQQPQGIVVNVEGSVLTKGSSALEVLERLPGVAVDRRYNGIALNGRNGVMVMVNGKLMRMSGEQVIILLNGMNANDIEKIELMTTPPARYDAEGTAGLINIVLKKNRNQGGLSVTGGYGWAEKAVVSGNISRAIANSNVYGSYSWLHDRSYVDWVSTATDNVPVLGGQTSSLTRSDIKPTSNSHTINAGFDTRFKRAFTLGANVLFSYSHVAQQTVNYAEYDVATGAGYLLNADVKSINKWKNLFSSVFAEKKLSGDGLLSVEADFLYYNNDKPTNAYSLFVDKNGNMPATNDTLFSPWQKGVSNSRIRVGVGKADFSKQLSAAVKLEAGVKGTYTKNTSLSGLESLVNGQWVGRHTTTNNILMEESIGALYFSLNTRLNTKLNVNFGARYEYSRTKMNDIDTKETTADRKLGKLFPTVLLTWKAGKHSEALLSYTRRISRPTYNDLASFVVYSDPTSVETGNSLLKPTIANMLKLGLNYKGYSFSILAGRDDHPIARYQISKNAAGDLMVLSPQNLIYENSVSFQTNVPVKVSNWYTMNYSFTGGWRQFELDYTAQPVVKSYYAYSFNFSQQFTLPHSYIIEVSGKYNSISYDGSKKVNGYGFVNAGIKKTLPKSHGTLQLAVQDIFKSMRIVNHYGAITEEAFNLKSRVPFSTETTRSPLFKLTYSRSFGKAAVKQGRGDSGTHDERSRIRD